MHQRFKNNHPIKRRIKEVLKNISFYSYSNQIYLFMKCGEIIVYMINWLGKFRFIFSTYNAK